MCDEKTHVVILGNVDLCGYWTHRFDGLAKSNKLGSIKLYCTQSPAAALGHISEHKKDVILVVFDYGMKDHLVGLGKVIEACDDATYFTFVSLCALMDEHEYIRRLLERKVPTRHRITTQAVDAMIAPLGIR